jgi:hypothetical protein
MSDRSLTYNSCRGTGNCLIGQHLNTDGLIQLKKLLPLKNFLTNLRIEHHNITDWDILTDFKQLVYLHLRYCRDAGLKHLAPLVNLKHLDLSDCYELTMKGIKALRKALHNTAIRL